MDGAEDDDDLKLIKASAGLLADLEADLPKVLWHKHKTTSDRRRAHRYVKRRDLNRLVQLIEPFQGEPHLLDAKLKTISPPIVDAYLEYIRYGPIPRFAHLDFQSAVCTLLYTLCKVRGYKIIVGFLSNEPRYLDPILGKLEQTVCATEEDASSWKVPYILLLWLSHLLLAPFDLSSISATEPPTDSATYLQLNQLPPLAKRVLRIGLIYLNSPTKAQDAAAAMLVRLAVRPDVVGARLGNALLDAKLPQLSAVVAGTSDTYALLGSLKLLAGIAAAAELSDLVPAIYRSCEEAFENETNGILTSNAVAKKIAIKTLRNIAISSLRSAGTTGDLLDFVQSTNVLENVIDYLLRSLADNDTPVRYAAAKAISLLVLELDHEMGHEVIQAVLDSFKEDLPRSSNGMDFATANPLKWHGLTLALAHTLFKRSASPEQLPDILDALVSALQFQQRTSTGTMLGTNIRDAANFGIWSLARRYTTDELLSVSANSLFKSNRTAEEDSIIQTLATQLILSACLDPAGNIRRGSSAALQEVVGRHPNKVIEGISLVQIVDYQAVSLRSRGMIEVGNNAAGLHSRYWQAVLDGLLAWRGLGSADVLSRENTASSITRLALNKPTSIATDVLQNVLKMIEACPVQEVERLHGLAHIAASVTKAHTSSATKHVISLRTAFGALRIAAEDFSPRVLRSEYPAALARYTTAFCHTLEREVAIYGSGYDKTLIENIDDTANRLLNRHNLDMIPDLVRAVLDFKRAVQAPLGCIEAEALAQPVIKDSMKNTLLNAGRAMALGALASSYTPAGLEGEKATVAATTLCGLLQSVNVDWRITGAQALNLVVQSVQDAEAIDPAIAEMLCAAMHRGLNDYTIDERGDIGSLVRLQCIACTFQIFSTRAFGPHRQATQTLQADIYRLSLEKLDRVRLQAARCHSQDLSQQVSVTDVASVSSQTYFRHVLSPGWQNNTPEHIQRASIQGCISCAGSGAEPLLQASRQVLAAGLQAADDTTLESFFTMFTTVMKGQLSTPTANLQPALALLAFLIDMHLPQRLSSSSSFKWRNLLSVVQKSHHKSNEIPKILEAVHVYIGLADVPVIRTETMKKLISMLRTNPYPHVRIAVAEALYVITGEEVLLEHDWARPAKENAHIVETLTRYAQDA
ncbi:hypothetical protein CERZMDRAFT_32058 [Cercospora zeae-maydis SCOH1-5]|uniref:Uncharacterized protein n=1 Tax=Cercospora zeae-maydis SCOH1-5 TaxID=717836 RepID=A0A6A6FUV8_9PEZI|nr:hypothetical protein CERZMDRAFT_32058 [Cercospora zeae-maydis SCOH1-5]